MQDAPDLPAELVDEGGVLPPEGTAPRGERGRGSGQNSTTRPWRRCSQARVTWSTVEGLRSAVWAWMRRWARKTFRGS